MVLEAWLRTAHTPLHPPPPSYTHTPAFTFTFLFLLVVQVLPSGIKKNNLLQKFPPGENSFSHSSSFSAMWTIFLSVPEDIILQIEFNDRAISDVLGTFVN